MSQDLKGPHGVFVCAFTSILLIEKNTIKTAFEGSARSLLANDIKNLRSFTNAPNGSLQQLIELNKKLSPGSFTK